MRIDLTKFEKQTAVFDEMKKAIVPVVKQALKEKFYDEDEFDVNATFNDLGDKIAIAFDVKNKNGETIDAFATVEVITHRYNAVVTKRGSELSAFDRETVEDLKFNYEQKKAKDEEKAEKARLKVEKEEREKQAREQARAEKAE